MLKIKNVDPESLILEEHVQSTILKDLPKLGYLVQQTTTRVKMVCCPACKKPFKPKGNSGASFGVTDLLVFHPWWPPAAVLAAEAKRPVKWTWTNDEQRKLWESGRSCKVTSWEEMCLAILMFEDMIGTAGTNYDALRDAAKRAKNNPFYGVPRLVL